MFFQQLLLLCANISNSSRHRRLHTGSRMAVDRRISSFYTISFPSKRIFPGSSSVLATAVVLEKHQNPCCSHLEAQQVFKTMSSAKCTFSLNHSILPPQCDIMLYNCVDIRNNHVDIHIGHAMITANLFRTQIEFAGKCCSKLFTCSTLLFLSSCSSRMKSLTTKNQGAALLVVIVVVRITSCLPYC